MTQVCRPTPFVRFIRHPRDLAESATSVSYGTACELGSIFTPGPVPENPLKCFFVENIQENWNHFFVVRNVDTLVLQSSAVRFASPGMNIGPFAAMG
jgi:hypothetical protein